MDTALLNLLVCPICKNKLKFDAKAKELICIVDRLAYPVRDGIPVMIIEQARKLDCA